MSAALIGENLMLLGHGSLSKVNWHRSQKNWFRLADWLTDVALQNALLYCLVLSWCNQPSIAMQCWLNQPVLLWNIGIISFLCWGELIETSCFDGLCQSNHPALLYSVGSACFAAGVSVLCGIGRISLLPVLVASICRVVSLVCCWVGKGLLAGVVFRSWRPDPCTWRRRCPWGRTCPPTASRGQDACLRSAWSPRIKEKINNRLITGKSTVREHY